MLGVLSRPTAGRETPMCSQSVRLPGLSEPQGFTLFPRTGVATFADADTRLGFFGSSGEKTLPRQAGPQPLPLLYATAGRQVGFGFAGPEKLTARAFLNGLDLHPALKAAKGLPVLQRHNFFTPKRLAGNGGSGGGVNRPARWPAYFFLLAGWRIWW